MENVLVSNIPIGVRKTYKKQGLYVVPTFVRLIGKLTNTNYEISLNNLDSFRDNSEYLDLFKENVNHITEDDNIYICDRDIIDNWEIGFRRLIELGYIVKTKKNIKSCACKRIEYNDSVEIYEKKLISSEHEKQYCPFCKSILNSEYMDVLVFRIPKEIRKPKIYPKNHTKNVHNQLDNFLGEELVISKQKETGFNIQLEDLSFNIDIEFLNLFMLASQRYEKKIIISSLHSVYHQILTYFLHFLIYDNSDYLMVFVSYLVSSRKEQNRHLDNEVKLLDTSYNLDLQILILVSSSWKRDVCCWKTDYFNTKFCKNDLDSKKNIIANSLQKYQSSIDIYEFEDIVCKVADIKNLTKEIYEQIYKN